MGTEILIKYIHFLCIFGIVGALVGEHLLIKEEMTTKELRRVFTLDTIYGVSALTLFFAGVALWVWVGKPAEFYSTNPTFHIKITLFALVGIMSIIPTVFFFKNRSGEENGIVKVPKRIKMFIRIELLLIFLIPYLATLVARGINIFS